MENVMNVKKKLAFGCMRLPMKDGEVDQPQFCKMIDRFIGEGFNYFDTAHGYLGGKSETAIRDCLSGRYPRESFILTDKLTDSYFEKQEDIRPFFENQLKWCGVDYFDFYLMHAQGAGNFPKFKACRAYETALELKAEGKIKHFGISFHDTAEVLEIPYKNISLAYECSHSFYLFPEPVNGRKLDAVICDKTLFICGTPMKVRDRLIRACGKRFKIKIKKA